MKPESLRAVVLKNSVKASPLYENCKDSYLFDLAELLDDHRITLDWLLNQLENFDARGYGGDKMETRFIGSKVIISDQYGEYQQEGAIEIDRAALIELVKDYMYLLEEDAEEIILFRDDQHITIVGRFEDKPEFQKIVSYRCRGHAFNEAEISSSKESYKMISCSGNDTYLWQLTKFLLDYIADLDTVIKLLEDPETTEITQGHMHAMCKKSKVTIINIRDEFPYDDEITMDRSYLIGLVKAWQKLIAQKPMAIRLQRNDDYITLVGLFGKDKPEYREKIAYRIGHWIA